MIFQRKIQILLTLLVISAFLYQNCATIVTGTSKKIPVSSNPSGAKIIVDGKEMGYAPMEVKLKRKKSHVIRIEKQGYNAFEIIISRQSQALVPILGNYFLGGFLGAALFHLLSGEEESFSGTILVALGWATTIGVDFSTGAAYKLSPDQLIVTLIKKEENPQPNFVIIDGEQFQNIKWLRIKCADSGKIDKAIKLDHSNNK